jgi:alpha-L-fucosidase
VNGESIYGTRASPFAKLDLGRCTQKTIGKNTRLYLHVFNWPVDGKLTVPGIFNKPVQAYLLSDSQKKLLATTRKEDAIIVDVPSISPDEINSVVVLDIEGAADINDPPKIDDSVNLFIDKIEIPITSDRKNVQIRYTIDGTIPTIKSPVAKGKITLTDCALVSARCFRKGKPVSGTSTATFTKDVPEKAVKAENISAGLKFSYYEGNWDKLPNFSELTSKKQGTIENFLLTPRIENEYFGLEFTGYIKIPEDAVYTFYTDSDDGSQLFIGDKLVVNNDGLHGTAQKKGLIPLSAGFHPIRIKYFNKTGGLELKVYIEGSGMKKQLIQNEMLFFN